LHCKTERPLSQGLENDVNKYLSELAGRYPNVTVLDLHPLLCDRQSCRAVSDGRPVYYDAGHLSMAGSRALGYKAIALGETPSFIDRDRLSEHNHAAIDDSAPRSAD
ncbi:SGNH hydrolase domain-containing protein, partial [Stenotrophomonas sp. GbtcB23]|uniref:SGNH hydrolase domain-containing protein n=1 Tax=Stenotrophomonas sp. GbtcB23 TaxID=2824768 RepID=UPI001C30BE2F